MINLLLVPAVRSTYEVSEGRSIFEEELNILRKYKEVNWIIPPDVVEYPENLEAFLNRSKKIDIDGMVIMSLTFHLGNIALLLSQEFPKTPMLCWAVPEPPYSSEGRVKLNSLVGAHLDVSNLKKIGRKDVDFIYGSSKDKSFHREFKEWIDVIKISKKLKGSKIGVLGGHAKTFLNIDIYEPLLLKELNVMVEYIPLNTAFNIRADDESLKTLKREMEKIYDTSKLSEDKKNKVCNLAISLKRIIETGNFDALAIRCWPEFATHYGISPCAAMAWNMANDFVLSCEGDILGAITMLMLKAIGCQDVYLSDISQIIEKDSTFLMWHCGVAPHTLWDGKSRKSLETYFAGGKGVTTDFVLKPGHVTIARVDHMDGEWRLFVTEGEAIPTKQELKGTYVRVKVKDPVKTLKVLVENGFPHHVVLGYGSFANPLIRFAKMKGWKVFRNGDIQSL
ncbi:fucose isomerase [Thermotoga sp. KOL6]|uniref:fucose isomerase n=1 Tax=Thermotoga sp. KOL6 TaxID=126741 RepID=UPI001E391D36|nr:fucose isomerase [Thermotoga sp. KOL6]